MVVAAVCVLNAVGCGRVPAVPDGGVTAQGTTRGAARGAMAEGPPRDAWAAVVLRVVDGDTVILRIRGRSVRVRLIGVDAPETWLRRDCFGAEAARALRRLAPQGSSLYAAGDAEPYDRYRRRLLYLWTPHGVFLDAALIRAGFARAMAVPPDTRYAAFLREAEHTARRAGVGLWKACP
jgi:micrococcal nuclease